MKPATSTPANSGIAQSNPVQRAGIVMTVLFLVFFLGISDNQMVSPLLPLIAREFNLASGEAGRLIGPAYALAAAFVALIVFFFNDPAATEIYTLSLHVARRGDSLRGA